MAPSVESSDRSAAEAPKRNASRSANKKQSDASALTNSTSARIPKLAGDRKKSLRRRKRLPERDIRQQRGVIYLGHIPHGFYETEMREFFTQFGVVTRVRLCRSNEKFLSVLHRQSQRSKGYAFIEFREPEVAKIAAETMDGYMMFDKRLQCHVVPAEHIHRDTFRARVLGIAKKQKPIKSSSKITKSISDTRAGPDSSTEKPDEKPEIDPVTRQTNKMQAKLNKLAKLGIVAPMALADKSAKNVEKSSATPIKTSDSSTSKPTNESAKRTPNMPVVAASDADEQPADAKKGASVRTRRRTACPAVSVSPANKSPPIAKRTRSAKRNLQ